MLRNRTGQGRQANPVAVILPRVEWQAAYVTDYSRYDNDTPDGANATRRREEAAAAAAARQRRRRKGRRRGGDGDGAARDPDRNTPTRIPLSPSLIPARRSNGDRASRRPRRPRPGSSRGGHAWPGCRVRIMTAAVVMENVNWDPGKSDGGGEAADIDSSERLAAIEIAEGERCRGCLRVCFTLVAARSENTGRWCSERRGWFRPSWLLWRRVDKAYSLFPRERRESYWSKLRSIIRYVTEYSSKTY